MRRIFSRRSSPLVTVSLIALFAVLGGMSYAVVADASGPASAGKARRTGWTIITLAPRTWWSTSAIDINDRGQIIGQGYSAPAISARSAETKQTQALSTSAGRWSEAATRTVGCMRLSGGTGE
jgi:hypothetical protein